MDASSRYLLIDIGNSGLKAACYVDGILSGSVERRSPDDWEAIDRKATNHGVENIIYSTVANVPPLKWIDKWKDQKIGLWSVADLPLPFVSEYETMETLGQDRIAAVAGSLGLTATARLIVDAGSCITLDLVSDRNVYLGGNISPGLRMRLRAMHAFTAKLPDVREGKPVGSVGTSTVSALLHGGKMGAVYEIEGLYRRLLPEHPDLRLLLTGGDAHWIGDRLSVPSVFYPNLVLSGLYQIMSYYVNKQ